MHFLDETSCAKGKPLRTLWTADEARMVKHILNNLTVKQWNLPSTEVERDPSGDWTIWIPSGSSVSSVMSYSSYFKLYDASDGAGCKIGVTDGGWLGSGDPQDCGAVKINGTHVYVNAVKETVTSDGIYYVWIYSWVDSEGAAHAKIIVGEVNDENPPTQPDNGVSYSSSSQLAGRVKVEVCAISAITQDYLHGGEHVELLFGNCFQDADLL